MGALPAQTPATAPEHSDCAAEEPAFYRPQEADFRPAYDGDSANQARQTWKEYWDWVQTFYAGNLLDSGWNRRGQGLLEGIRTADGRSAFLREFNSLGREIAAEWAKDNGVRKVDTTNLRSFGLRLNEAQKKDDGTGQALRSELESIRQEVQRKLAK